MAIYRVNPEEKSSHVHESKSTSTLLAGQADILVGENRIKMVLNVPIDIPAKAEHTVINMGDTTCSVKCIC